MTRRPRISQTARVLAVCLVMVMLAPATAWATPESELPLQERVALFQGRIDTLNRDLEITAEELNSAAGRLAEIQQTLATREAQLEKTREEYQANREALDARVRGAYRQGPLDYLELLLGSSDIPSLINKYEFIMRTSDAQRSDAAAVTERKQKLENEVIALRNEELRARAIEFELKARNVEMEHRKAEYQQLFDTASAEVLRGYENNQARQRTADSQSLADLLSGDYTIEPGGVVETALHYRGVPYVWGGESVRGMDCSGLVLFVFKQHGVSLPHYSGAQYKLGLPVPASQLKPGDVVFFGSPVHHVGIYAGGEYFIHAPTFGDVVKVSKLTVMRDYVGARRYAWTPRVSPPL